MRMDPKRINRDFFFARVKRGEGCWEWTGFKASNGYGRMNVPRIGGTGRVSEGAHRVSWVLANGPIPDGAKILHSCDNPGCVRPDHLRPGTDADNARDRDERGRHARLSGEKHGGAKLTEAAVAAIKSQYVPGSREFGQYGLARRYGVGQQQISRIIRGQQWSKSDAATMWTPWTVRKQNYTR